MRQKFLILISVIVAIVTVSFCIAGCSGDGSNGGQSNSVRPNTEQSESVESVQSGNTETNQSEGHESIESEDSEKDENGGSWTPVVPFD